MKVDYTGLIQNAYAVRHKVTGEVCIVPLGARYNQQEWELLFPIHLLEDICSDKKTSLTETLRS